MTEPTPPEPGDAVRRVKVPDRVEDLEAWREPPPPPPLPDFPRVPTELLTNSASIGGPSGRGRALAGAGKAWALAMDLVAFPLAGLGVGWLIDRKGYLGMVIGLGVGLGLGVWRVIHTLNRIEELERRGRKGGQGPSSER